MSKNILIVEDNMLIAMDIKNTILNLGFSVMNIITRGEDAIEELSKSIPDLIIMDIYLDGEIDGIQTAKYIKENNDIPIIYLTSHLSEDMLERAFKTNPEAYITKPFKRDDLQTSILLTFHKTQLRKQVSNKKHIGHNFYIDENKQELYLEDSCIKLGKKEWLLLYTLIKANGDIVKLEELECLIWTKKPASSSSLRTLIYRVRTKLNNKLIETVPYYGCRIKKL